MAVVDQSDPRAAARELTRRKASGRTRTHNYCIEPHSLPVRYPEPKRSTVNREPRTDRVSTMHPIILGLFDDASSAAAAARALHAAGVRREQLSVVSRNHDE